MVSGKKTRRKQAKIITSTGNFCDNVDFPSIGLAVRESWTNIGSQVSTILVMPILSPTPNPFFLGFYVLATSKVKRTGSEQLNCCQIYLQSLVFYLMLIDKHKKNHGNPRNRGDLSSLISIS